MVVVIGMASCLVVFCRFWKGFRAFHLNTVSTYSSIIVSNITRFVLVERHTSALISEVNL